MAQGTRVIGIIGGMGPSATYDLAQKIVDNTLVTCDQDHLHVLVDCDPSVPDRTEAIMHGGPSPVPGIVATGRRLQKAGAELLLLPCNTSHHFFDEISAQLDVELLHMPRETASALAELGVRRAAVLCTEGTRHTGVYDDALGQAGIETLYPDDAGQRLVTSLIYDYVKRGRSDFGHETVAELVAQLQDEGADACVLACTELPIVFALLGADLHKRGIDLLVADPAEVLARAAVVRAGGRLRG